MNEFEKGIQDALELLIDSNHTTAFTGAGISVESGIPPFRGENGLWSRYDPVFLDINYFYKNPVESWRLIKEIFYEFFGKAEPNEAHYSLAELEKLGYIKAIITQNIDYLHQKAGSKNVIEFHGTSSKLICEYCNESYEFNKEIIRTLPPRCKKCNHILKPDFVFFSEPIPEPARRLAFNEAEEADVFLVIGTTGEIYPASQIPYIAKRNGVKIIEINVEESNYTDSITDVFIKEKATIGMKKILEELRNVE